MSMQGQNNLGKRKLLKDSPFQKLAQRTEETGDQALKEARRIDMAKIETNPRQPRRTFDADKLDELAQDIAARGILQPPIVRPIPDTDRYEIVVGERRYQAARQIGLKDIPVIVRDLDDQEAEITSLVENIQREDLTMADEASFFKMLQTKYGYSIREIADEMAHKSHSYVDVRLKLAEFPEVLKAVQSGKIKLTEANQLMRLGLDRKALLERIEKLQSSLEKSLTVFSKDTLPEKSQSGNEKKPITSDPHDLDLQMSRPVQKLLKEVKTVSKRLEQIEFTEKKQLLQTLAELEYEVAELRRRIQAR